MTTRTDPALTHLDAELRRLARPRVWSGVRAAWAGEPLLAAFAHPGALLAHLRGTGPETDPVAARLAARATGGDGAALALLLGALAGVFVAAARRRPADATDTVGDLLSLAAEVACSGTLPERHVLAVVVSRAQSRHRRMRRRLRAARHETDELPVLRAPDDPARLAVVRSELHQLRDAVHQHVAAGSFTVDDWRRLVELRVHRRTSGELARAASMTPAAVRKRVQRTAELVGAPALGDVA